jgi:hypothetical protein
MPRDVILHVGTFGRGFSGKTTLNKQQSAAYWENYGIKSLVLDKNREKWNRGAFVTDNEELFWNMVWHREKGCALFVEEAAETIARDNGQTSLFTRVRHRGHRLHVSGHSGTNLLPEQRNQLHVLNLFQQTPKAAAIWRETFMDERIMEACELAQYEFLHCVLWGDNGKNLVKRCKLAL